MKRSLFLAIAGLAGSGCSSSGTSYTFATCPESRVDYVVVTYAGGGLVDPLLPQIGCLFDGVQGVLLTGQPSGQTYVVTGYQNVQGLGAVATYSGRLLVPFGGDVVLYWQFRRFKADGSVAGLYDPLGACPVGAVCNDVTADGIPADFDIYANFVNATGTATIGTYCAAPSVAIDSLAYTLVDHLGTEVAGGSMSCGDSVTPAGVSLTGANSVDLDDYSIRIQGFQTGIVDPIFDTATKASVPSFPNCTAQTFPHFGTDTGTFSWDTSVFDVSANALLCP